jgi:hypothetical protein
MHPPSSCCAPHPNLPPHPSPHPPTRIPSAAKRCCNRCCRAAGHHLPACPLHSAVELRGAAGSCPTVHPPPVSAMHGCCTTVLPPAAPSHTCPPPKHATHLELVLNSRSFAHSGTTRQSSGSVLQLWLADVCCLRLADGITQLFLVVALNSVDSTQAVWCKSSACVHNAMKHR